MDRAGAYPFSSFEKTLQGREQTEENLFVRDREQAAKIQREAELSATRLAGASASSKRECAQDLAKMLHQKHLMDRQKTLGKVICL